jgi:hypothetical protein
MKSGGAVTCAKIYPVVRQFKTIPNADNKYLNM